VFKIEVLYTAMRMQGCELIFCLGAVAWFEEDLSRLASQNIDIKVSVYITGGTLQQTKEHSTAQSLTERGKEIEVIRESTPASVDSISLHSSGRPNLPALIKGNISRSGSMAIIGTKNLHTLL
jgi:hypothetical protein